jgi:hypothetical protein
MMIVIIINAVITPPYQNEIQRVQATLKNKLHVEKKENDDRVQQHDAPDSKSPPHMSQFVRSQVPPPSPKFPVCCARALVCLSRD